MNESQHTPGPWRSVTNRNAIVADSPANDFGCPNEVEYYSGYLVCESVALRNARLIAAAPVLLDAILVAEARLSALGDTECMDQIDSALVAAGARIERSEK